MKNLTEEQVKGMESLIKRRNDKEITIFQTDKSSKFSVDSLSNYVEAANTHIEGDTVIDGKQFQNI